MLRINFKKTLFISLGLFLVSSILFATNSYALFENLTDSGSNIFMGMRNVIYAVSGFGIVAVAIGGFFGNLNWKWLSAIIIGLVVIAVTAAILDYMVGPDNTGAIHITDTLINADGQ